MNCFFVIRTKSRPAISKVKNQVEGNCRVKDKLKTGVQPYRRNIERPVEGQNREVGSQCPILSTANSTTATEDKVAAGEVTAFRHVALHRLRFKDGAFETVMIERCHRSSCAEETLFKKILLAFRCDAERTLPRIL